MVGGAVLCCLGGIATAQDPPPAYQQYLSQPIPLGVRGGNAASTSILFTTTVNGRQKHTLDCVTDDGTLGGLVADQNNVHYILSTAHLLALGPAAYFGTGSQEPIVQPDVLSAEREFPPSTLAQLEKGCQPFPAPPAVQGIDFIKVATLSFVVPIDFSKGAVNQADAALAKVLPGMVGTSQYGIPNYSGTPLTVTKKGMAVQTFGETSGLTTGQIMSKMEMPEKFRICTHLPQPTASDPNPTCTKARVLFKEEIETTPSLGSFGDSGALVMTTDACPRPVGIFVGGIAGVSDSVTPIANVFSALISSSAGALTSLSIVPGGTGCTPADPPGDPDVAAAQSARAGLEQLLSSNANFLGCVDGIGVDLSGSVATLDVTADDGSVVVNGMNDTCLDVVQTNVAAQLGSPATFESVPVEVSEINTYDTTGNIVAGSFSQ